RLTEKGYSKILIGVIVDLYSKAWWANAYVCPGESSLFVIRFLMDAMGIKADPRMIYRGVMENLYWDSGPGNTANATKETLSQIGITTWHHFPGNAKAKGMVESRIGHYKNSIERMLWNEKPETIERYREITQQAIYEDNKRKGFYQEWSKIFSIPGALIEFDDTMRNRLGYSAEERKVNTYGCVSISGVEYFIAKKLSGEWVTVYTLFDGTMKAIDRHGLHYPLTGIEHQYHEMTGKVTKEKQTEYDAELAKMKQEGKRLRGIIKPEHFLDDPNPGVVPFNRNGEELNIDTAVDVKRITSIDEVWTRIWFDTRISKKDIRAELAATIDEFFAVCISKNGGVTPKNIQSIIDIITDSTMEEVQ
ncbi:MAG TPA: hypothetical protein PKK43_15405, partial [Spirochaetota bacterium]|nr:hypothetical protein [Spirochaetota bacterium]